MRTIMIGAVTLAAVGLVAGACTTRETRIIQTPAVMGAAPGSSTTVIRSNRTDAPVVVESEEPRDLVVHID
jgi:hypothetical protein